MKKISLLMVLVMAALLAFSQQNAFDVWVPGDESVMVPPSGQTGSRLPADIPVNPVLYNNGPLVTHPGGGYGGADASVLQTNLGMSTYGFGHQVYYNYWVADDFTVPEGGWDIEGFAFFAYQTYSDINSTITAIHLVILDGPPNDVNSNIVFGDQTTNRMTSSDFTNIYRVLDYGMGDNYRPIMLNACMFDLQLEAGTYWVMWQTDGTLSSGPWAPPVTILGQTTTGNALQYVTSWASALDTGTSTPQDFAFLIYGAAEPVPVSGWALLLGGILIAIAVFFRYRRS